MANDTRERRRGRGGRALPACALLLALSAAVLLFLPLDLLFPPARTVLAGAFLQPEEGLCFLAPFPLASASDADDGSVVRLQEDGRDLLAHALHGDIRTLGGGRFSHWGRWLYLSSTDGSDPRVNGRRYEILLPGAAEAWPAHAALAALIAAAALALAGAWRGAGRAGLACALGLLLAAALAATAQVEPARWSRELRATRGELADTRPAAAPASDPSGTQRLGDSREGWVFTAAMAAPPPPAPLLRALRPDVSCTPHGAALVVPSGAWLRADGPLGLPASDVTAVELPVRVTAGSVVRLAFELEVPDDEGGRRAVEDLLDLPVTPDGVWRTLRVTHPLLLAQPQFVSQAPVRLVGLRAGNGDQDEALVAQTGELRLVTRAERFLSATHGHGEVECADVLRPALWLGVDGELTRAWPAGDAPRLRTALGLAGPGAARWELLAEEPDGARRLLARGTAAGGEGWGFVDVALPGAARPARLVLRAADVPPGSGMALAAPRLLTAGRPPRRVLLVLADTLRADALSCQGGPPGATPALDALAGQGARCASCWSQSYWTRPSMPSVFTGRYVAATGVNTIGQRLPEAHVTLAERFAAAGFHTAAWIGNSNAGPDAGLQQGFDEMHLVMQRDFVQDSARYLTEFVEPRLRLLEGEDLFVYVHLMQPHGPYGPPEAPPGWQPPGGAPVTYRAELDPPWHAQPTDAARRALYAGDVSALDAAFGVFLAARLEEWERGPFPGPVVVGFMSDHGERLGEGGAWGHAWGPMGAEVLHVPLLLRAPGRIEPGTVCDAVVQNIDVGATLLELAGVSPGPARAGAGRSLLDRLQAAGGRALASAEMGGSRIFTAVAAPGGLVGDGGRLVSAFDPRGRLRPLAPPATLWDLSRQVDPDFRSTWERYLQTQGVLAAELRGAGPELSELSPAALQDLRALGYLGGH